MRCLQWITTTPDSPWQSRSLSTSTNSAPANLCFSGARHQTWEGFGGCFNELGWVALSGMTPAKRAAVIASLFDPADSCRFTHCRMPIGASDYAAEWYSLDETDGDFQLEHFSIERDRRFLIPYIRQAQAIQPQLRLFASPWSPPTWLKFPKAYNHGTLIWQPAYLETYARYFLNFVRAYRAEGIPIAQIHVQNEPCADQKFPSCLWTGEQMRDFICDYLGPLFRKEQEACEIWLGTLNTDDYDAYPHTVLSDPAANAFVAGVGFQWAGKGAIQRTAAAWPDKRLMQTENECGEGKNSWEYARYVFGLLQHYISNGANAYVYWNMALAPGGKSTWGWSQNAMITADPATDTLTFNPEFYVMKHCSRFIAPGAVRLGLQGPWTSDALAFENPDGTKVLVVGNPFNEPRALTFADGETSFTVTLDADSYHTFMLE